MIGGPFEEVLAMKDHECKQSEAISHHHQFFNNAACIRVYWEPKMPRVPEEADQVPQVKQHEGYQDAQSLFLEESGVMSYQLFELPQLHYKVEVGNGKEDERGEKAESEDVVKAYQIHRIWVKAGVDHIREHSEVDNHDGCQIDSLRLGAATIGESYFGMWVFCQLNACLDPNSEFYHHPELNGADCKLCYGCAVACE